MNAASLVSMTSADSSGLVIRSAIRRLVLALMSALTTPTRSGRAGCLSPRTGNSYSNLPTFSRVTLSFRPEVGPGGMPYVTDNAQLGGQGATVWVEVTPLQLSTSDNSARLEEAGCGYLGSAEMVRDPGRSHAPARTAPPTAASPSASPAPGTSPPR